MPASGSSSSIGASDPLASSGAGVRQRSVRVGALEAIGPVALGEVAIRRGVAELDRASDAELGEARGVLEVQALGVLDPLAQAARPPLRTGCLEGVEGLPVRTIADRVDGDRPAGASRPAHDVRELLSARDPNAGAVEEPGGAGTEGAVHERLQVSDPEPVVADPGAQAERLELVEPLVGQRLPDAQRQRSLLMQPLPEPRCAEPAVLVVDRGDPARVREPDPRSHRLHVLVVRNRDERAEAARRTPRAARRSARRPVELDDAARDGEIAVRAPRGQPCSARASGRPSTTAPRACPR